MIKQETNQQRKAHRLHIPIVANIDNENYTVLDWSVTGVGVLVENDDAIYKYNIGQEIDTILVLVTNESSINIHIKMVLKVKIDSQKKFGFEITHITQKNKRVLRHFATLAIEGDENKIEALVADMSLHNIKTPLAEPISVDEHDTNHLRYSFTKKVVLYIILSICLFISISFVLIYNYFVVYHGDGLVTGNEKSYQASKKGEITKIFVTQSQNIEKGMSLYELTKAEENNILDEKTLYIEKLEQKSNDLNKLISIYLDAIDNLKSLNKESQYINKTKLADEKKLFEKAKKLYNKRLITFVHFNESKKRYENIVEKYMNKYLSNSKTSLDVNSKLLAINEKILLAKEKEKSYKTEIKELQRLEEEENKHDIVVAHERGIIHSIKLKERELVDYKDTIMVIQNYEKAHVLLRLKDTYIYDLMIGQKVIVKSNKHNKKYLAKISSLGYSATNGSTKDNIEVSQHETPIRIDLIDNNIKFNLNERVEVWIIDDENYMYKYIKSFLFEYGLF